MDFINKIIGLSVGLVVGILMVTKLILPTITKYTAGADADPTYSSLIEVVGLLAVVVLVVFAARAITSKRD